VAADVTHGDHASGWGPSGEDGDPTAGWRPDTLAVRGGLARSDFDETAEALYLTQGYVYDSAAQAEAAFAGDIDRFIYSRTATRRSRSSRSGCA
jgi:cystathionine beta-lyase/cystathionine gamma-synthase